MKIRHGEVESWCPIGFTNLYFQCAEVKADKHRFKQLL